MNRKKETKVQILRVANPNEYEYRFSTLLEDASEVINIPNFQRGYVWDFQGNIKVMIDDLKTLNDDDRNDYFSGNIILTQTLAKPIKSKLIDGQQRLTTLLTISIISKIVIAEIENLKTIDTKNYFVKANGNKYDKVERPNFMLKKFFELATNNVNELIEKWIKNNDDDEKGNLVEIYKYLSLVITSENKEFWLKEVYTKIVFSRVLISNDISSEVFENINHKSKPLTTFELIRNKLFMLKDKYDTRNTDDQDGEVAKIIEDFEKVSNFLIESNKKNDIDSAVRIIFMYLDKDINDNRAGYLDAWKANDTSYNYQLINNLLSTYSEDEIISVIKSSANKFVKHLEKLKTYKSKASKTNFWKNQILLLIDINPALNLMIVDFENESDYKNLYYYFISRVVRRRLTKSKENLWTTSLEIFRTDMKDIKNSNSNLFVKDSDFRSKFVNDWNNAYSLPEVTKTILSIYEKNKKKSILDVLQSRIFSKELTIEHIFPNGNNGSALETYVKDFGEGKVYKNFIGNLALLEKGINSSSGKDNFIRTKVKYKKSSFYISGEFEKTNKYTYEVFKQRCNDIYESFEKEFSKN